MGLAEGTRATVNMEVCREKRMLSSLYSLAVVMAVGLYPNLCSIDS